ncbi:MmgE/PrpD family protein [Cognatishimia sp. MH4019]|uniref:MmgE/PrpD family protein n=1 Tax=Cognatishimia sp. MH4019 TaxID=2854030 RepID=UPI001CD4D677|nr:MmgE/PrpD family protein [Cognatishimia sp. MH4019]
MIKLHDFSESLSWDGLDEATQRQAHLCLMDLIGVGFGGAQTELARIITTHAARQFGGSHSVPFSDQTASAAGVALATGMTIDALDGHDGFNPSKGHIGCGVVAGLFALAQEARIDDGKVLLEALVFAYEIGARLAITLHETVPDYHTSGAWVAVAVAAMGARMLGLPPAQMEHAMGIAEYHGPRSQMMRCIDHPTMVKDGSGWGAMAGVSAALLARDGFTGAPALTAHGPAWEDLGARWYIHEQYFKPYPVCRWAQPPVEAALALRRQHGLVSTQIKAIEIASFHECTRLATSLPASTEDAQYSTSFPCAVAFVRDGIAPSDLTGDALKDPEILRLSQATKMVEAEEANAAFPLTRLAQVHLTLQDGTRLSSDWHQPRWDHDAPPTPLELREKFDALVRPVLGIQDTDQLANEIMSLANGTFAPLLGLLAQPIRPATTASS